MAEYPFIVRPLADEEGSGWLVEFPDLPGCMADGETPEMAAKEAEDAFRSYVATLRELGRPVPARSDGRGSRNGTTSRQMGGRATRP